MAGVSTGARATEGEGIMASSRIGVRAASGQHCAPLTQPILLVRPEPIIFDTQKALQPLRGHQPWVQTNCWSLETSHYRSVSSSIKITTSATPGTLSPFQIQVQVKVQEAPASNFTPAQGVRSYIRQHGLFAPNRRITPRPSLYPEELLNLVFSLLLVLLLLPG